LRHAIELVVLFHPLLLDETRVQLCEHMGSARLRCEFPVSDSAADRSMAELITAGLVRTLRAFGCRRSEIHAVCFEHHRPVHHQAYSHAFSGAERFAQAFTGVEFSARALDRPNIHRHPELSALLRVQAERSLQRLGQPQNCMSRAARELALSVRSLRRHLLDEGTSFRTLAQSLLRELACTMLRDPNLTLQTIAFALGFTGATAFHRAFKRLTGVTPAEYREAALRGDAGARDVAVLGAA
jgi:AraC-like DNA-binding protein